MQLLNLFDYEKAAAEKMLTPYFAYYAGGVADNLTLKENRAAFERIKLRPRVMRNVGVPDLRTNIGGTELSMPIMLAPAAMHKLAHPDGELGSGRAAKMLGTLQILSTMSTVAVEEVAALGHPVWFQLYIFKDRGWSAAIVRRAEAAGCQALVVTVDLPVPGLRENLIRAEFRTPESLPFPNLVTQGQTANLSDLLATTHANFDPTLSWADIGWLRSITRLPIWVKGVLRGDDAQLAVEAGVDGIIVSNHGGRQLDTAVASVDALPEIATAVNGQIPVLVDGGIRRGSDVLKALALGANGVLIGRPYLFGLAVNGEAGATHVLQLLRDELINIMAQCGCATIADITPDLIWRGS